MVCWLVVVLHSRLDLSIQRIAIRVKSLSVCSQHWIVILPAGITNCPDQILFGQLNRSLLKIVIRIILMRYIVELNRAIDTIAASQQITRWRNMLMINFEWNSHELPWYPRIDASSIHFHVTGACWHRCCAGVPLVFHFVLHILSWCQRLRNPPYYFVCLYEIRLCMWM